MVIFYYGIEKSHICGRSATDVGKTELAYSEHNQTDLESQN